MIQLNKLESKVLCVSVIVTTFNRVKLLPETINSILGQTFDDFELIIVDNMSIDGTSEYVEAIADPRVRYFRNPNNGVIAVNRNYGLNQARGKYIAFCDDDDLWLSDKLKLQVKVLEKNASVALCYTNAESFMGDKTISLRMVSRVACNNHFLQLLRGNFIPNSSVLIRRNALLRLGCLTEDSRLREDYEMCLRLAYGYQLEGIDVSLIRYRIHPGNVAGNRTSETLRAIRTVKSVIVLLNVPYYLAVPNIAFQYIKYLTYKIIGR